MPLRSAPHFLCLTALLFFVSIGSAQNTTAPAPDQLTPNTAPARLQLSAADYARSESMRPRDLLKKLKNGFVLPHWIGQTDDFWYRRDTAQGHEFVIVHAANGHTGPAFDHQAMASAFSKASGTNVAPDQLPFEELSFNSDPTSIHVTVNNTEYGCSLKPANCSAGKPVFPPPPIEV